MGTGFGETARIQTDAPTAASGGLPLETYSREALILEGSQNYLGVGTRWAGLGAEASLWQGTRLGARGTGTFAEGVPATSELADGSFGGQAGTVNASEWGWSFFGQQAFATARGGRMDLRVTLLGAEQDLAGDRGSGFGASGAGFWRLPLQESSSLLCWIEGGPFGSGRGRAFASRFSGGLGLERAGGVGLAGGAEGMRLGAEGARLGEGPWEGGAGLTYWFGGRDADGEGMRFLVRAGVRGLDGSVVAIQPRFGLGVSVLSAARYGVGADYAVVPFGDFGALHFFSARIVFAGRLASPRAEAPHTLEGP